LSKPINPDRQADHFSISTDGFTPASFYCQRKLTLQGFKSIQTMRSKSPFETTERIAAHIPPELCQRVRVKAALERKTISVVLYELLVKALEPEESEIVA
jgi:hypothetical protein